MKENMLKMSHTEQTAYFALLREGRVVVNSKILSKAINISLDRARDLLSRLYNKKILFRIGKGKYVLISPETLHKRKSYINDPHYVVDQLMGMGKIKYYIAYQSAAYLHGIAHQLPLVMRVAIIKRHRPISLGENKIKFVTLKKGKFFGVQNIKYGEAIIKVSNLEKTLVDCLDRFDICGGIEEVVRTIALSTEKVDFKKLLNYLIRIRNQALIQRMGFILEKLSKLHYKVDEKAVRELAQKVQEATYLLDPHSSSSGHKSKRWKLIENIDITREL